MQALATVPLRWIVSDFPGHANAPLEHRPAALGNTPDGQLQKVVRLWQCGSQFVSLTEHRSMSGSDICTRAITYLKPMVHDSAPAISMSPEDAPVLRPFTEGLLVSYVTDTDDHLTFIQQRHLEQEGVSVGQLHSMAISNLQALAEEKLVVREYGAVYVALMGGNFEASLLALDVMWNNWYAQLAQEGFVAVAPARDLLAFCDASSEQGLVELRQVVQRSIKCDHPLHPHMYRRIGTGWQQSPIPR